MMDADDVIYGELGGPQLSPGFLLAPFGYPQSGHHSWPLRKSALS
jgi:hypothetical protein